LGGEDGKDEREEDSSETGAHEERKMGREVDW